MVTLYGKTARRRALAERTDSLSQFAGVQLSTLGNGFERSAGLPRFRAGTGLRFSLPVERAMDIGKCEQAGHAGPHSPASFRNPELNGLEGEVRGGKHACRAMRNHDVPSCDSRCAACGRRK